MASAGDYPDDLCRVVVLTKDGDVFRGIYDGYGRVRLAGGGTVEVANFIGARGKMVAARFYKGETFEQLGKSNHEPGQGCFHNQADVEAWYKKGGFPTYKAYCKAFDKCCEEAPFLLETISAVKTGGQPIKK